MTQLTFAFGEDAGNAPVAASLPRWTQPRNFRSFAAEAAFRVRLEELGATLLEPVWLGSKVKHRAICAEGHPCTPTPHYVRAGNGICMICGGRDPATAEARFRALLAEAGAELLEPYRGAGEKHKILCAAGHVARQKPSRVLQGVGICRACARRDPATAEAAFRARVEELGGKCRFAAWGGAMEPHHVTCAKDHDAYPVPARVQQGQGICWTCAGTNPKAAEAAYRELIISLGATPLWECWPGSKGAAKVRCPEGHIVSPRPNDVMNGSGICKTCAGLDPAISEARFRARLAELGATPLFDKWTGRQAQYDVLCAEGHSCRPWANSVMGGQGVCWTCSGTNPAVAEATFRARIAEAGGICLYETWLGNDIPLHCRCAAGHDTWPRPSNIQRGGPVCGTCIPSRHTVFYVLEHESDPVVKFGISNSEGRRRLIDHRASGYTTVHLLLTGLAAGTALDAENAVRAALAMAGEKPVQGREYFDRSCLALILDVAASWLGEVANAGPAGPGVRREVAPAG